MIIILHRERFVIMASELVVNLSHNIQGIVCQPEIDIA